MYHAKDQKKSSMATQYIGLGNAGSSTDVYRQDWGDKANTGVYISEDKIFISINGDKPHRVKFDAIKQYVDAGIAVNATFITDIPYHRNRAYNIGEREVADYLTANGYVEQGSTGVWVKH